MIYDKFSYYSKNAAHWLVDNTFPNSPTIASTMAFAGWYSYRYGMTYSQSPSTSFFTNQVKYYAGEQLGSLLGHFGAPLVVPDSSPYISHYFSVGVSCMTSLTLNLISKHIFSKNFNSNQKVQPLPILPKTKPNATLVSIGTQTQNDVMNKENSNENNTLFLTNCDRNIKNLCKADIAKSNRQMTIGMRRILN